MPERDPQQAEQFDVRLQNSALGGSNDATQSHKAEVKRYGIVYPKHPYKSHSVNIRPPGWCDSKFWLGKIKTEKRARKVVDAVLHYIGQKPHYNLDADTYYPKLGIACDQGRSLTTRHELLEYVKSIGKGEGNLAKRQEFREHVMKIVKELAAVRQVDDLFSQGLPTRKNELMIRQMPNLHGAGDGIKSYDIPEALLGIVQAADFVVDDNTPMIDDKHLVSSSHATHSQGVIEAVDKDGGDNNFMEYSKDPRTHVTLSTAEDMFHLPRPKAYIPGLNQLESFLQKLDEEEEMFLLSNPKVLDIFKPTN